MTPLDREVLATAMPSMAQLRAWFRATVATDVAGDGEGEAAADDDDDDELGNEDGTPASPVEGQLSRAGAGAVLDRVAEHMRAKVSAAGVSAGTAAAFERRLADELADAHAELPVRSSFHHLANNGVGCLVDVLHRLSQP